MAVLRVTHDLTRHGSLTAQRTAELANDAVGRGGRASIQVDVLARERRAPTVGTAVPVGLQGADTATEQDALELLDMAGGGGHGLRIRRLLPGSCQFVVAKEG
jgi:hypothetical protein